MKPKIFLSVLLAMAAFLAACSTEPNTNEIGAVAEDPSLSTSAAPPAQATGGSNGLVIPELPSAVFDPDTEQDLPQPVSMTIDQLGISQAPVGDVGVEPNGEMEVPGPREVGWYGFGVTPGEDGSSVLAAHIASEGIDGVFRNLDQLNEGDLVSVEFDDGSTRQFSITGLQQYNKAELPFDDIFRRSGDPQLVLITCGGDFNPTASSYDDNVVAYAEPIG